MTIVVGVAAPDGMILAGDSRSTYTDGTRHRIASDFTQKVFTVCESLGVATYGLNSIGQRTIAGLMDEFVTQLPEEAPRNGETIAASLGEFFDARFRAEVSEQDVAAWEASGNAAIGFLIAGYDTDGIGRIREVSIPGGAVEEAPGDVEVNTALGGTLWRGQTDVIRRLVFGFDGDLFAAAGHQLPDDLDEPITALTYNLLFPITMQDAVDFASFLIRTTIDMQRFSDGTTASPGYLPGCGGPIRILAVTRDGDQWVSPPVLTDPTTPGLAEGSARAV